MFQRLYDRTMSLASHRHAMRVLALVSFAESSIFPIPPDAMLIPMVLAHRDRAWAMAAVCTVASVLGGILGYIIGYFLFEAVGRPILDFYGFQDEFQRFADAYNRWGLWIILIKGLTPIPYKLVTIASGAAHFDLFTFVWASIVTRGARFYLVAALLWKYGEPIRTFVEERLTLLTWLFLIALVGGFVAVKYLF